jgi:GntR family transcriptional repressor for pyruvate dehydrogenase complex
MILHGQFNGLDRLPAERSFADEFGVSKHHFREALRLLEQDGLVEVRSGRNGGVFLSTPGVEVLTRTFSGMLARNGTTLADLMQARSAIEPAAAALAVSNATDEDIARLKEIVGRQASSSIYESDLNTRFHVSLAGAAHNGTLLLMMRSIESIIESVDIDARQVADAESAIIEDSVRAHYAILRALERRDKDLVVRRVDMHIAGWEQRLRETGINPDTYSIADVLHAAEGSRHSEWLVD